MQIGQFSTIRQVGTDILKHEGWKGFYRGFGMTVFREIPFACVQFPLYEKLKSLWATSTNSHKIGSVQAGLCGMVAGGVAAAVTTPLDVMKTRIMTSTVFCFLI